MTIYIIQRKYARIKQLQVDFEISKVIFNKNFTSHMVSVNSVYNGDNSLYFINPLSLCVCSTNTTNSIVSLCVCMLFDERDSLLPKRYKQNSNVSSEFVDSQLPLF